MTDVFISYSRRDKEFVQRLFQALKDQQRDIWVDWEDIPPTADWRAEIRGGMEATHAVIFVISPDSVRSKECRVELELALENNKRLVPLMYRMVTEPTDQETMHPALNSHNWVYLRDEDDFNAGLQTLVKGLDTDLAYVRAHTRLQVRAREWTAENHDGSLLLRGKDLIEAESWLAGAVNKQPAPTPLHTEYIAASRRAEIRRARRLLIGVSVALVVSALLGVLAFGQWQQAATNLTLANTRGTEVAQQAATSESNAVLAQNNAATADANALLAQNNEATAVYNEGRARSNALAAQALVDSTGIRPDRAVLLGLSALQNEPYTAQAERVLANAVRDFRLVKVVSAPVESVAWSPDGESIAVGFLTGLVQVYDVDTFDVALDVAYHGGDVTGVAWSPDGTHYASVASDGTVTIQEVSGARETVSPTTGTSPQRGVDWSLDSTKIVVANDDSSASIYDAASGDLLAVLSGHNDAVNSTGWSPDGTKIVTGSSDDTAKIWDAETGEELLTLEGHQDHIFSVAWSPDGTKVVTGSDDKTAKIWDAETGEELLTLLPHGDYVNSAVWSPDGSRIVTASDDKTAKVWDAETGHLLLTLVGHSDPVWDADWSPDSTKVVTASSDGTFRVWDVTKPADPQTYLGDVAQPVTSPDYAQVATADYDTVTISDAATGETRLTFAEHDDYVNTMEWSADGQKILTSSDDKTAKVWDAATGEVLLTLSDPDYGILSASWSPDNHYIVTITDSDSAVNFASQVWDTETGKQLFSTPIDLMYPPWSPDGTKLVIESVNETTYDYDSTVWDVPSAAPLFVLPNVVYADWSPDGSRLAAEYQGYGADPQTAAVWDSNTGEELMRADDFSLFQTWSPDSSQIATFYFDRVNAGAIADIWDVTSGEKTLILPQTEYVKWSPDGMKLLVASLAGDSVIHSAQLFDAASGQPLVPFGRLSAYLNSVAWTQDQKTIVGFLEDGSVKMWDAQTGANTLTLNGHNDVVMGLNWSPDGERIVTASADKTAKVWDGATGAELYTLPGHTNAVYEAAWLDDGQHIVTAGGDGTIKAWRTWQTTQDLIDYAENCCIIRALTSDEQAQFGLMGGG